MKKQTIVLDGMPGIEWAAENLTGHGGVEVNGNWYYTWEQAMAAAAEVGDGWRLPTRAEFERLCKLESTWDDDRKGRWFGGNHATDHNGSIFLPASGYRNRTSGALSSVCSLGFYWSSSPYSSGSALAGAFGFMATYVHPLGGYDRAFCFTVRLAR